MQNAVFTVEFLFLFNDGTQELRSVGTYTSEAMARVVAFDKAESYRNEEGIVALLITKTVLNEEFNYEIIEEYYFDN